ncbi:50S ribosomal protein L1 [Phytophthora cinnamomi]|uniref:50S ribosomal protein L1 n=1 Tax=Phytophthora cinnamomi TaxID=4785 RepID=UPI00355A299E|nr:50S ribosomal protein L1 [Phytophthora cinnamomi]
MTMATAAAPPRAGASEATTVFHDEPWTAEVARLLLEVDEGWVGYRGDAAWSWHEETYTAFAAVCAERRWPANSQGACVAMLHALRTGAVNMKLSRATRSSDGCAQWSLVEMRELGAQMRRVVDGQLPTARWSAQLVVFVAAMRAKDASYSIDGRSVEDFAVRAGKYVPDPILRVIDPNGDNGKTPPTERSMSPARQPSRKYQRGQNNDRVHTDGRSSNSTLFRSLNPYDRPGKPWGEFVVEVLLAERAARNEDELDYVQFVRGLYEI